MRRASLDELRHVGDLLARHRLSPDPADDLSGVHVEPELKAEVGFSLYLGIYLVAHDEYVVVERHILQRQVFESAHHFFPLKLELGWNRLLRCNRGAGGTHDFGNFLSFIVLTLNPTVFRVTLDDCLQTARAEKPKYRKGLQEREIQTLPVNEIIHSPNQPLQIQ